MPFSVAIRSSISLISTIFEDLAVTKEVGAVSKNGNTNFFSTPKKWVDRMSISLAWLCQSQAKILGSL